MGKVNIKILGFGCARCRELECQVRAALAELGLAAAIERVDDVAEFMRFRLLRPPGLIINGRLVSTARVPSRKELITLLGKEAHG